MKRDKEVTEHEALYKMRYGFYLLLAIPVLALLVVFFYNRGVNVEAVRLDSVAEVPQDVFEQLDDIVLSHKAYVYNDPSLDEIYLVISGGEEYGDDFGLTVYGSPEYQKRDNLGVINIELRESVARQNEFHDIYEYPVEIIRITKVGNSDIIGDVTFGEDKLEIVKLG